MTSRILTVVGARPQFVKAAVLGRAISENPELTEIVVHTGQHFDDNMSNVFFRELGIPDPSYNLGVSGSSHGRMTGDMLIRLEEVMQTESPDAVLVFGDTNSTLAGALAAAKLHIPIIHVEAGLRSFNRRMPEEINRVLTDHASQMLLCPTRTSVANLKAEGIVNGVHFVGDVMYDLVLQIRKLIMEEKVKDPSLQLCGKKYVVATVHRSENTDDVVRFEEILDYVIEIAREYVLVMPVHPRIKKLVRGLEQSGRDIRLIEPLGYLDMQRLIAGSEMVLTDSGGLQKEACFHGKPCVTLRDETEWSETIDAGWNRLWTVPSYRLRRPLTEFGDGDAANKIADLIAQSLGEKES